MEFIILINGNSKLQTYVPGQKGHQSSIFQEFKRATFRFITDLKDLQMKKSSIEVVQFSGCLGMDGHYIPGKMYIRFAFGILPVSHRFTMNIQVRVVIQ